jgi:hypothetical protein
MQVKEAVERASRHLPEVFPAAANRDLRLEGVEKTDDGLFWKVTFSYTESDSGLGPLDRDYKTVKLRDANGELMGAQGGMLLSAL